jgi:excisionase family DNA binding protein
MTEILSTGQAAQELGCSRQHVVDLCSSGKIRYHTIGHHRRIERRDLESFKTERTDPTLLHREQMLSLWLSRAVAGAFALDPGRLLAIARENQRKQREVHAHSTYWIDQWEEILTDQERVLRTLTGVSERDIDLRQNSPFAGALSSDVRQQVLDNFAKWRKGAHAMR